MKAPSPDSRNAREAVQLAERAAARRRDVAVMDALAIAYASAGRYEEAITFAGMGLDLAVSAGQDAVAAQFRQRLELYRPRQPFRMPRMTSGDQRQNRRTVENKKGGPEDPPRG